MGFFIRHIGNRAHHHKRHPKVMADVSNGRGFHLYGNRIREMLTDLRQVFRAVDKGITTHHQAAHRVKIQLFNTRFGGGDQFLISLKPAGQPGN